MISIIFTIFVLFAFTKGTINILFIYSIIYFNSGENCESPKVTFTSYSTKDARLTAESVAQLEITVKCKNGKQVCYFRFILFSL
jgi:hypothetical protein